MAAPLKPQRSFSRSARPITVSATPLGGGTTIGNLRGRLEHRQRHRRRAITPPTLLSLVPAPASFRTLVVVDDHHPHGRLYFLPTAVATTPCPTLTPMLNLTICSVKIRSFKKVFERWTPSLSSDFPTRAHHHKAAQTTQHLPIGLCNLKNLRPPKGGFHGCFVSVELNCI